MKPGRNESALYGTVKTYKFEHLKDVTIMNLTFRPITDQIATFTTCTPSPSKVILIF